MRAALDNGPLSVAVAAGSTGFMYYQGGVVDKLCGADLDHGVTIVGFGSDKANKYYWVVRNSWGASWGEKGYIRVRADDSANKKAGMCGINSMVHYPNTN
jgi:C1A family cysteine protease